MGDSARLDDPNFLKHPFLLSGDEWPRPQGRGSSPIDFSFLRHELIQMSGLSNAAWEAMRQEQQGVSSGFRLSWGENPSGGTATARIMFC